MRYLQKAEPFIFYLLVLIHALPVLVLHFFPTVDGPAHLYNSNLINNYFSSSSVVHEYFSFNSEPEPNWLGHFLLCLFNSFMPSYMAEKIVILLYIISLPIAFRSLIKAMNPENSWASYFIFPFLYTLLFYLGFYNFCLSISLLIYLMYYRLKKNDTLRSKLIFATLLLLLYFAHLFAFLLFAAIELYFFIVEWIRSRKEKKYTFKQLATALIPFLPGLLLTFNFLLKKAEGGEMSFLPKKMLLTWLKEAAPLITLSHDNEYIYTSLLVGLWSLLFLAIIITRIKKGSGLIFVDHWLLISFVTLAAYFILPDDAATGGYISLRILLFFFILLVIWLSVQPLHKAIFLLSAICSVAISLILLDKHYTDSKSLSADVSDMYTAADHIEEEKTVLPLNYSGNWLHSNFSNYLGSEKNIIVLDNYEASKPHFPLKWKENKAPYDVAGDFANSYSPCLTLQRYEDVSGVKVDYITRWYFNPANQDSCTLLVNELLRTQFEKVYTSPQQKMEVFKRIGNE